MAWPGGIGVKFEAHKFRVCSRGSLVVLVVFLGRRAETDYGYGIWDMVTMRDREAPPHHHHHTAKEFDEDEFRDMLDGSVFFVIVIIIVTVTKSYSVYMK
jgi:hypothetical protein